MINISYKIEWDLLYDSIVVTNVVFVCFVKVKQLIKKINVNYKNYFNKYFTDCKKNKVNALDNWVFWLRRLQNYMGDPFAQVVIHLLANFNL